MQALTVGLIVQYRQARGSQAWLPAIVTVTEETFVPGLWAELEPLELSSARSRRDADRDGEVYIPSEIPPVKPGRVHLRVLSPTCSDYAEFNVQEGAMPGTWRWPQRDEP